MRERSQLLRFTPTSFWAFLPCKGEACPLPTEIELQLQQKGTLDTVIVYEGPLNADFKTEKLFSAHNARLGLHFWTKFRYFCQRHQGHRGFP